MTNTPAFRSCRPFSLLLQSSASFIDAQRNLTLLNSMLWGICNTATQKDQCAANMGWFASTLPTACADELSKSNAMAAATLISLHAFGLMRETGCLSDPTTNTFCYLNAVRNPNPSDLYFYQLPLGIGLPKSATPSCSACTRSVMEFYANALIDPEQAKLLPQLFETYGPAANRAIQQCGAGYAKPVSSGIMVLPQRSSLLVVGLVVLMGWNILLYSP